MKSKATQAWAFIVSMSVVAATAVMAQQPAELPEQAAAVVLTTLSAADVPAARQ